MRSGFTLIELVVALLISSLIALSLFQLLQQARKTVRRITNVIAVDEPSIAFYQQLEKDVTGMFAPSSSLEFFSEKEKAEKGPDKKGQKPDEKEVKASVKRPIENVFMLDAHKETPMWSFITTGALQVLDADGTVLVQPAVRRVLYMLEKDPQRPEVFRLMYRFSAEQLEVNALKAADFSPSYELISGLKNLEIELTLFEQEEKKADAAPDKKAAGEQAAKKPPPKPATIKEWNEEEIWTKYRTLIPAYVKLKGAIVDVTGLEYPFEYMFKVYAYRPYKPREKSLFEAIEEIAKSIFKKG